MVSAKTRKAVLRDEVRNQLRGISPDRRVTASVQARSLIERQNIWKSVRTILFYAPQPDELDIWPLVQDSLAAGKIVALPRFDSVAGKYAACRIQDFTSDIRVGQFGIREPGDHCAPVPLDKLDLILVPGIAFDVRGHRLGRGKGFYDRLLASVLGITCGVAFDEQIVERIPVEAHDIRLNHVLTPTRWIECGN